MYKKMSYNENKCLICKHIIIKVYIIIYNKNAADIPMLSILGLSHGYEISKNNKKQEIPEGSWRPPLDDLYQPNETLIFSLLFPLPLEIGPPIL